MEPSANVSSRTPGAISLPGMGSGLAPGAGGVDTAIGTCEFGGGATAAGAGDNVFAGSDEAAATFWGSISSPFSTAGADLGAGAGSSVFDGAAGGGLAAGTGSAVPTLTGFTSASRRFFASAAKLPLG